MKDTAIKQVFDEFISNYEEKIKSDYYHVVEHHDEIFTLKKFIGHLDYTLLEINPDFFYVSYVLIIADNYSFKEKFKKIDDLPQDIHRELIDLEQWQRIDKLVPMLYPEAVSRPGYRSIDGMVIEVIPRYGKELAEREYRGWKDENDTSVSNFNHETISPYSHLDYEGIVRKFNDDNFKKDFLYQMKQAEECYKRKLYLPAAATLSVALETVLLSLCKKEGIKIKDNSMLNYLGELLQNKNVINYRLGKRIDITYSLRNSLAHSNKGEVAKADCEIILNCIRTVVDNHY